ncbi:MAG: hypothetical protein M3R41_05525 [Pseudomonadota bacterium]|nr:hypothetical protein [Pseudomonadota bacterium]
MTNQIAIAADAPSGPVPTIFEAIVRRLCLTAVYNRTAMTIAPHILYTRHDQLHVDGVVVEKGGQPPREPKVGTFRLTGLNDIALADRPFFPDPLFEIGGEKYHGVTLLAVEPA